MLHLFRKSANSVFIKVPMIILVFTFVLWGIGDVIRHTNKLVAFKVGDREYTDREWQHSYQQQKGILEESVGKRFSEEEENMFGLKRAILSQIITKALLLEEAKNLGLLVSDDMVRYEISAMPAFITDGKFDKQAFERILRNSGMNEQHFVNMLKDDIASQNLSMVQSINKEMPDVYYNTLLKAKGEMRYVKLYRVNGDKLTIGVPKDEELQEIYKSNLDTYSIPEQRDVKYITFGLDDIKSTRIATEEELKEQYNNNIVIYTEPEKRKVLQLVFKEQSKADEAAKSLQSGRAFNDVAKEFFPDKTHFLLGEDVIAKSFDKEISDAIFGLKVGEFSKPTQSPMGWHIFKVESIKPSKIKSFDEVKTQLRGQYEQEIKFEALNKFAQDIDADIDGGAKIADLAKKYNLKTSTITNWKSGDKNTDQLAGNERFNSTAFGTDQGSVSKVTPYKGNDKLFVLEVTKVVAKQPKKFEQVREEVTKIWEEKTRNSFLSQRAKDAATALVSNEKAQDTIAKFNISVSDAQMSLLTAKDVQIPAALKEEIFKLEVGKFTDPIRESKNSFVIAKLEKTSPADETKLPDSRKFVELEVSGTIGEEMMHQYINYLRNKYDVMVYEDVINMN